MTQELTTQVKEPKIISRREARVEYMGWLYHPPKGRKKSYWTKDARKISHKQMIKKTTMGDVSVFD